MHIVEDTLDNVEVTSVLETEPRITTIENPQQAAAVSSFLAQVATLRAKIEKFFRPQIDQAHKLHKALLAKLQQVDAAPKAAETKCRRLLSDYAAAQEEARRQEQLKLERMAREAAAAIAKKAAEEAARENDVFAQAANQARVEKIQNGQIPVTTPAIAAPPKVNGVTTVTVYRAELEDIRVLIRAIAVADELVDLLVFNQSYANQLARERKGNIKIPGVKIITEQQIRRTS